MKFFIAKMVYKDGDLAYPWSLFAETFTEAVHRLETGSWADEFSEITVRELPMSETSFFGRDPNDKTDLIIEHQNIPWQP